MKHTLPLEPGHLVQALEVLEERRLVICLLMVIWNVNAPEMYAARRVRLLPGQPTSNALPRSIASDARCASCVSARPRRAPGPVSKITSQHIHLRVRCVFDDANDPLVKRRLASSVSPVLVERRVAQEIHEIHVRLFVARPSKVPADAG